MSLEIDVLRALFRLSRRGRSPTLEQIVVRVGGDALAGEGSPPAVHRALAALARQGLVQRTPSGLRLSLAGLAVAIACARRPEASRAAKVEVPAGEGSQPAAPAPPVELVHDACREASGASRRKRAA